MRQYLERVVTGLKVLHLEKSGPLNEYRLPGESQSGSAGTPLLDELREVESMVPSELCDIRERRD